MRSGLLVILGVVLLSGCASRGVIIDQRGVNMEQYQQDLQECEAYAEEVHVAQRAAAGAATGAVLGSVVGAVVGNSRTAERVAGVGAVSGGSRGAGSAIQEKHMIVRNCLKGRGYRVLN